MNEARLLTPNDVAKLLLVSPVTVRQWAQNGLIASQTTPGEDSRWWLKINRHLALACFELDPMAD